MDSTIDVNIDLVEWYEDDIGQYQEQGLPRKFDKYAVPTELLGNDDAIGNYILDGLESVYGVKPVLISWNVIERKEVKQ